MVDKVLMLLLETVVLLLDISGNLGHYGGMVLQYLLLKAVIFNIFTSRATIYARLLSQIAQNKDPDLSKHKASADQGQSCIIN